MKIPSFKPSFLAKSHPRESSEASRSAGLTHSRVVLSTSPELAGAARSAVSDASQFLNQRLAPKKPVALINFAKNPPALSLGYVVLSHPPTDSLGYEELLTTLQADPALGEPYRHWMNSPSLRPSLGLCAAEKADRTMKIRQIANVYRLDSGFAELADNIARDANRLCNDRSDYFLNQLWSLAMVTGLRDISQVDGTALLALGLSFMRLDLLRQKAATMFDLSVPQSLGIMAHVEYALTKELGLPLKGRAPEFECPQYISSNTLYRLANSVKEAQLERGGAAIYKYLHGWQPWVDRVQANPVFGEELSQLLTQLHEKLENLEIEKSVEGSYLSSLNSREYSQHTTKLRENHKARVNELLYLHCQAMANVACELHLTPEAFQASYQESLKQLKLYNSSAIAARLASQRHLGVDSKPAEEKADQTELSIPEDIKGSLRAYQYFEGLKQGLYSHSILKLMESCGHIKGQVPRSAKLLQSAASVTNAIIPFAGSAFSAAAGLVNLRSEVSSIQTSQKFRDNLPATSGPEWDTFVHELSVRMAKLFLKRTETPDFDKACFNVDNRYLHHFNQSRARLASTEPDAVTRGVRRAIEVSGLSLPAEVGVEKRLAGHHLSLVCDAISDLGFKLSRDPKVAAHEAVEIVFGELSTEM